MDGGPTSRHRLLGGVSVVHQQPMPDVAPVMMATLPANLSVMVDRGDNPAEHVRKSGAEGCITR